MSLLEHEEQTLSAFKSNVEDLALVELTRLQEEEKVLSETLAKVNENIKAVKSVLRATKNGSVPGPKKQRPKKQSAFRLSDERGTQMNEWLAGNEDEITSKTVHAKFPEWSESYCNMALKYLREAGALRLSGTAGSMNIYRSMI